ncbi:hypothetical protein HCK70_004674 [Salmonella enterica]|nr:hypothetical protein [Salmonella enterica]
MIAKLPLTVEKRKRSWCICAGKSVLGKFRTEDKANDALRDNRSFYEYWSESASVISENTMPVIIII